MATCKDCLSHDVCGKCKTLAITADNSIKAEYRNDVEKHCDSFKDEKHHLKVPCVVGDTLYWATNSGFIHKLTVTYVDIKLRKEETEFDCWAVFDLDGRPCQMAVIPSKIGEIYFFNLEDAQKVLKERESRNEM